MREVLRRRLAGTFAVAALALPSPVLMGDWPDPSLVRTDEGQVAVMTSGGWAPTFRILRSDNLRTWRIHSAVFYERPRWARRDFWAPEITRLSNGRYAVFYSAMPRRRDTWLCLGVATAAVPEGPWTDLGRPLRCGRQGAIDPFPVRDERGALHLLWKSDGNQFGLPTSIHAQRLREDGLRLLGRSRELIRNDRPWEGSVVEAPTVIRRPDAFYLLYSANGCCTRRCNYAVGVARAKRLIGPWRKFEGNPILRGGNGWRCPGHVGLADQGIGGLFAVFHAFREGRERLVGRQVLAAPISFRLDGWPVIGNGAPPPPSPGGQGHGFADAFPGPALAPEWEWPFQRTPGFKAQNGLLLGSPRVSRDRVDGAVLSRRIGTARYNAYATIDRRSLAGSERAGLASYRNRTQAIGAAAGTKDVIVWRRGRGGFRTLFRAPLPRSVPVALRLLARGRGVIFERSFDGRTWRPIGRGVRSPVREAARMALTAGGARRAKVRFLGSGLEELLPEP